MQVNRTKEQSALRGIRRVCYAGLDSVSLRTEVGRRLRPLIPSQAFTFATTDPDTGLLTHAVSEGVPTAVYRAWLEHLYPYRVAEEVIDMAHRGPQVTAECSEFVRDVLHPEGLAHDLRGVASERGDPLGFVCLLRDRGSRGFTDHEAGLLRQTLPHLSRGLRTAALADRAHSAGNGQGRETAAATEADPLPPPARPLAGPQPGASAPGILVVDQRGRIRTRNAAARTYVRDLHDNGHGAESVPSAIGSVVGRLVHQHRTDTRGSLGPLDVSLRTRGHSGRWYTIRGSLTEPDAAGRSFAIVLLDEAGPAEVAPILSRLYGLTPREREVVSLVARGASTKRIARRLGLSPYTVQEYVGNACAKVGVRTRGELLAKLFLDGYAGLQDF